MPCGITDAGVTSLTAELGRPVTVNDALDVVTERLRQGLNGELELGAMPAQNRQRGPDRTPTPTPGVDWHLHPALAGQWPG